MWYTAGSSNNNSFASNVSDSPYGKQRPLAPPQSSFFSSKSSTRTSAASLAATPPRHPYEAAASSSLYATDQYTAHCDDDVSIHRAPPKFSAADRGPYQLIHKERSAQLDSTPPQQTRRAHTPTLVSRRPGSLTPPAEMSPTMYRRRDPDSPATPSTPKRDDPALMSSFATQVSRDRPSELSYPRTPNKKIREAETYESSSSRMAERDRRDPAPPAICRTPRYEDYANVIHPAHKNSGKTLLPYYHSAHRNRHLLLLDLDETLVHASASPVPHDVSFTVEMENQSIRIYVKHRPYMIEFLRAAASLFEVGVFTASLSKYADQVLDNIDPHRELITHRLFREHCTQVDGSYVKDLSILGRPMHSIAIVDNSPVAYLFHPGNAIPCTSWFDDPHCTELRNFIPLLERMARSANIMTAIAQHKERTGQ
jgi:Dullard-like phosphatase family protein